jgi:hypothetical protein
MFARSRISILTVAWHENAYVVDTATTFIFTASAAEALTH